VNGVSRISGKVGQDLGHVEIEVFHIHPMARSATFWGIAEDEDVLAAFWVD